MRTIYCVILFFFTAAPLFSVDSYLDPYSQAVQKMQKGKHAEARRLLRPLLFAYDSENLPKVQLAIAHSFFLEGKDGYDLAETEYREFLALYPAHSGAIVARAAICGIHYAQMEKLGRQSTHTALAVEECRLFLALHPNSEVAPSVQAMLTNAGEVLAENEYQVALYYHRKGYLKAATSRLQSLLDHYPTFSKRRKVNDLLLTQMAAK